MRNERNVIETYDSKHVSYDARVKNVSADGDEKAHFYLMVFETALDFPKR